MELRYIIEFHPNCKNADLAEVRRIVKRISGSIENNQILHDGYRYSGAIIIQDHQYHEFLKLRYITKMYLDP